MSAFHHPASSRPSSGASSFAPPSRSATSSHLAHPTGSSSTLPQPGMPSSTPAPSETHSRNPLSSKLKNMFGSDKHAIFAATVVIHEMGNVPQLQGNFAVAWKFRGRRPRGKESLEVSTRGHAIRPKPSLPSLKPHHPSPSTLSVRTSSTTSSLALPPTPRSLLNPESSRQRPSKAYTVAIPTESGHDHGGLTQDTLRPEKKASDPTPLKQVLHSSISGNPIIPIESPRMMEEPEGFDLDDHSAGSSGSTGDPVVDESRVGSRTGSRESSQSRQSRQSLHSLNSLPPNIRPGVHVNRPSMTFSRPAAHLRQDASKTSLAGGGSGSGSAGGGGGTAPSMSAPLPRSTLGGTSIVPRVPVRSGTMPSYNTLLDSLSPEELRGPAAGGGVARKASIATTGTADTAATEETESSASGASGWRDGRPAAGRGAYPAASGMLVAAGGGGGGPAAKMSSIHRKGETPIRPLRSHACKWDFELHHSLRIPITKPGHNTVNTRGGAGGQSGQSLPVLGGGPTSESGIELTILQYPVSAVPAALAATTVTAAPSLASSPMLKGGTVTPHGDGSGQIAAAAAPVPRPKVGDKSPIKYGTIDVDLAPFAGKGRMTRRFLLKGSRTNATVKVTVELRFMGGEENWVPPPMQEGHHVTGMVDLMAEQHEILSDLHLVKTPSGSSSSDSNPLERTRTNMTNMTTLSTTSSHYPPTRNHSASSLGLARTLTNTHHEPYEYHLREPSPARHSERDRRPRSIRMNTHTSATFVGHTPLKHRHVSPARSSAAAGGGASPASMISAGRSPAHSHLDLPRASPAVPPLLLSFQEIHHRQHNHHSHHMRVPREGHGSGGHGAGGAGKGLPTMHDLPPESIIEAIFNPYPAAQAGPFTYVPETPTELEAEDVVVRRVAREVGGEEWEDGSGDGEGAAGGAAGTGGEGGGSGNGGVGLEPDGKTKEGRSIWRMRGRARAERARKESKEKER